MWKESLREFRCKKDGGLIPKFRGGLEVNVHGVNGGGRLDLDGFLGALEQWDLGAGPWASAASTSGLTIRSARRRAASGWGAPFIMARVLGIKRVPSWPGSRSG